MEESIADRYYALLERSQNKAAVLVAFLREASELNIPDNIYPFVGKLVRVYGAKTVFYSILAVSTSSKEFSAIDSNFFGYLSATCKNIFAECHAKNQEVDLTKTARQLYRRLQNARNK
ncbi:MAG: hypothetical protein ACUVT3_10200 [Ignavibacterium sp.]